MLSEIVHVMLIRIFPPLGGGTPFLGNLLISQLDLTWNSCCSVEHVALHTILGGRKLAANLFDKPDSSHLFFQTRMKFSHGLTWPFVQIESRLEDRSVLLSSRCKGT